MEFAVVGERHQLVEEQLSELLRITSPVERVLVLTQAIIEDRDELPRIVLRFERRPDTGEAIRRLDLRGEGDPGVLGREPEDPPLGSDGLDQLPQTSFAATLGADEDDGAVRVADRRGIPLRL